MLNLGGDHNLAVTISKFTPNVECTGQVSSSFSIAEACHSSLDTMPTAERDHEFSSNPPPPQHILDYIVKLPYHTHSWTRRGKSFQSALLTTVLIPFGDKMISQLFPVQ